MREKKQYLVFAFASTTDAMAMEKRCGEEGIPGRLIPVPREITAGCGLAWRILQTEYEESQTKPESLGLSFSSRTLLWL